MFNLISCQPNSAQYYNPQAHLSWKRPTRHSRAWKKNQSKIEDQRFRVELSDQPRDSAVDYACDKANGHLFSQPPSEEITNECDFEDCSDKEVDDPLDQEESEWDDQSELDIMADPDYFHPFLITAAPIKQEVDSVYSHHDGSKNNVVLDSTLTVGPISHEEAVPQPILLPMMPIDPELAAPNNNLYFVAPIGTPTSPLHDCHVPLSAEAINPVHTYLDRNIVPKSLEATLAYRQPNQSLDSLSNDTIPDFHDNPFYENPNEYDDHNQYSTNHNYELNESTSNEHHNYTVGQAEEPYDQQPEYEAGHDLYNHLKACNYMQINRNSTSKTKCKK
ncbi:hypothetical protein MJO28_009503 [Puccinia striiformis f. sp. tritici]|uniref:Uncharacterized protein n=1 Tax=Puccinia striiformis f. sp. tritici TaxID=168172 RepID=A0ACC0E787_9BASI|nr:hypothetical protein MJO28_009503 [Puccinia striiformis f. sp. tritici]